MVSFLFLAISIANQPVFFRRLHRRIALQIILLQIFSNRIKLLVTHYNIEVLRHQPRILLVYLALYFPIRFEFMGRRLFCLQGRGIRFEIPA